MEFAERFWSKVDKTGFCWVWTAAFGKGYGKILRGSRSNGTRRYLQAHRVSWELTNGPIPNGMCVLHKCDNPKCVNPEHLFLGSLRDNTQDMIKKGRAGLKQYR